MRYKARAPIIAATLLLIMTAPALRAQARTEWGIKGGVTRSDVVGDDTGDLSFRSGSAAGLFASIKLTRLFVLQPELLYEQKGVTGDVFNIGFLGESVHTSLRFHYLEVPMLARLMIPVRGKLWPSIYLGPAFELKLQAVSHEDLLGNYQDRNIGNVKRTNWNFVIGLGTDYQLPTTRIVLDFRFTLGLSRFLTSVDLADQPDDLYLVDEQGNPFNWRHSTFLAMAGVVF